MAETFAAALKRLRGEDRAAKRTVRSERRTTGGRLRKVLPYRDERLLLVARGIERTVPTYLPPCDGCGIGRQTVVTPPIFPTNDRRGTAMAEPVRVCLDCFPNRQQVRDGAHSRTVAAMMKNARAKRERLEYLAAR